uniref:Uncharacterized protein n=1 Tax=Anopheles coluzzii TaxID=1518534 RepID=A0A6E8V2D7_ANOCL|nr:uncharacterized protein LOC120961632 [Anopheles coluzzii]
MPRIKKRHDEEPVMRMRELPETLTAGRSRRTIKPNPKYMNDEMLVPTGRNTVDENEMSAEEEYIVDYEENDDPEDSGLVVRRSVVSSTPQTDGQPRRRGRPPKQKNVEAPRTEPVKNLRKEVLKKLDYRTISISKSRHMGSQQLDGRRKLNLTIDSVDTDSADQDEMDDMDVDRHSLRSRGNSGELVNRTQKVLNSAAPKKQLPVRMMDRRGSAIAKGGSMDSKIDATTEEDEYDDEEEDYMNDSDAKMSEEAPAKRSVGRPRKHPVKQVSPFGGKVLLPGMKTSPTAATPVLKRKAAELDEEPKPQESQQSKMLRRSYGLKSVHGSNQSSQEGESEDNYELEDKKPNRSSTSFQTLARERGRPPKGTFTPGQLVKTEKTGTGDGGGGGAPPMANRSLPETKLTKPSPTITIVNVSDIIKMRSKSSGDLRRRLDEEAAFDSEDMSEQEEAQADRKQEDGKTNNQLVASILERKRPISLEHLQKVRRHIRDMPAKGELKGGKQRARPATNELSENDVVDFEDVLQKNIVSADKDTRLVTVGAVRGRSRPAGNAKQDENYGYATKRITPGSAGGKAAGGGAAATTRRSLQPPRILNATMKLGDNRPRSKQAGGSGDNHYSIDLTDPDNNVKLVSSSNENSPSKRSPAAPFGQKTPANVARSATGVVRDISNSGSGSVRSSPQEVKKKRVTLYETWNVLHIRSFDSTMKPPQMAMNMISLGNSAADIVMPSSAWSFRTLLEKRKVPAGEGDLLFAGKIQDVTISEEDKANYEPSKIMFRRKAASPGKFNVQFDRTVTFRGDTYSLNVNGQSCKLMAAPSRIDTIEDIETLLQIVDHVDLKHSCIQLQPPSRLQMRDASGGTRRVAVSKDPVIM